MEQIENGQISKLNDHMFKLLDDINDPNNPDPEMTLKKAKATVEVATVIVNSVKTGIDYMRVRALAERNDKEKGLLKSLTNKTAAKQLGDGKK